MDGPAWVRAIMMIAVIIGVARVLGLLAQRLGQPRVLGELVTGLVLGASALGVLHPDDRIIAAVGEVGLVVLLFEIGLETDLRALTQVGKTAAIVGAVGVVLPLILGAGCAALFGLTWIQSLLCGAALTATSIGISVRVLQDIGRIDSNEGRIVLGAAVLDDIAGLLLLATVSAVIGGGSGGSHSFLSITMLGAFAAGMVLHRARVRERTEQVTRVVGFVVVPVFFAVVGAEVQLQAVSGLWTVLLFVALLVVGFVTKLAAGFAPWGFAGNRMLIGLAMVPRGEVGLVFATTARASNVFDERLFSIVTLVVMATTFLAPPLMTRVVNRD